MNRNRQTVMDLTKMTKIDTSDISKDNPQTMEAYISEAQIMSCDGVDR
jgi:hypothetical protein